MSLMLYQILYYNITQNAALTKAASLESTPATLSFQYENMNPPYEAYSPSANNNRIHEHVIVNIQVIPLPTFHEDFLCTDVTKIDNMAINPKFQNRTYNQNFIEYFKISFNYNIKPN